MASKDDRLKRFLGVWRSWKPTPGSTLPKYGTLRRVTPQGEFYIAPIVTAGGRSMGYEAVFKDTMDILRPKGQLWYQVEKRGGSMPTIFPSVNPAKRAVEDFWLMSLSRSP